MTMSYCHQFPKSWDEVLLDQFVLIKTLDPELSFYTKQHEILSILMDVTGDDPLWDDLEVSYVTDTIKGLSWLSKEPSSDQVKSIYDLEVIDINRLTLGEFIDLEHYFSNYYENLHIIAGILYRKTKLNEWDVKEFQQHASYNIIERAESFLEEPVTKFYWLIKYYLDFKEMVTETYDTLFSPQIEVTDDDYVPDEDDLEQEKIEAINAKWSWETVLHQLSNGDITKYEEITNLPVIFVLNQLSFRKEMKIE